MKHARAPTITSLNKMARKEQVWKTKKLNWPNK